jgi:hypothetical protein
MRRTAAFGYSSATRKKVKFVPIAAVVSGIGEAARADQEMSALAGRRREGFTLAGAVWRNKVQTGSHCSVMDLDDLATGVDGKKELRVV